MFLPRDKTAAHVCEPPHAQSCVSSVLWTIPKSNAGNPTSVALTAGSKYAEENHGQTRNKLHTCCANIPSPDSSLLNSGSLARCLGGWGSRWIEHSDGIG
eukprot:7057-Amphidinium_carterae.1